MEIVNMNITDVKPYENNPRINDGAVEATANSIKEFGFQQPIVVDKDNVIIVGHTRLRAAKKLGLKQVPVVTADNLTDEQVRAYRLADNKTGELADWDEDLLKIELGDVIDLDMTNFGFEDLIDIYDDQDEEAKEDDFDSEVPEEPKSKLGQIYKLGRHRLMCGDSTKPEQVAELLGGRRRTFLLLTRRITWRSEWAGALMKRENDTDELTVL